jgi:hypothetical protein
MGNGKAWTTGEIEYLRKNWPEKSEAEIAASLGRSVNAVQIIRYKLNLRVDNRGWTPEDLAYLTDHWKEQSDAELAAHFGKSESLIQQLRNSMGLLRRISHKGKNWSLEDIEYLRESWGTISMDGICKHLGRSPNAIAVMKNKLGLGRFLESGEYVTMNQLMIALTGLDSAYSYQLKSWVKDRGMPVHNKKVGMNRFRIVYLEEFWPWAEKHRSFINFSKMEPLALGEEPAWVAAQRRQDFKDGQNYRKDPWTYAEDDKLKKMLKQFKYGYMELSKELGRSCGAIQRRILDLGLKERPVKADNRNMWTKQDFITLADMIKNGFSYGAIGEVLGRSEKAIRGKAYFDYLTENADSIRAMIGSGPWGAGAPIPTVRQGVCLSRTRTQVAKDLSALAGLIAYRRNQLGYEPYWQRHMCMKWDDVKACTAGCQDCDSCTEFERIKPQYCVRCGKEFFEREANQRCKACRKARQYQHLRKRRMLHGSPVKKAG